MISTSPFGTLDGTPVYAYDIATPEGLSARFMEFGARVTELHVPDRDGRPADVVLGFDDLQGYATSDAYVGATCGRYGNRIARGRFELEGRQVQLDCNEGRNHLHGGRDGWDRKVWAASFDPAGTRIRFETDSADGEMGFPGACRASCTYELDGRQLRITMECESDAPTIVNMVHHSYFNLTGHDAGDVLGHEVTLEGDFYTPVDDEQLATGEILSVLGTPFDFRHGEIIGSRIDAVPSAGDGTSGVGGGYDHNWVLRGQGGTLRDVATVHDPASGRILRLRSTEPGVQLYTGGHLSARIVGKRGARYRRYAGFALETQKFPCSPNHAHFPSTKLMPGESYRHQMVFDFSTDSE